MNFCSSQGASEQLRQFELRPLWMQETMLFCYMGFRLGARQEWKSLQGGLDTVLPESGAFPSMKGAMGS